MPWVTIDVILFYQILREASVSSLNLMNVVQKTNIADNMYIKVLIGALFAQNINLTVSSLIPSLLWSVLTV